MKKTEFNPVIWKLGFSGLEKASVELKDFRMVSNVEFVWSCKRHTGGVGHLQIKEDAFV